MRQWSIQARLWALALTTVVPFVGMLCWGFLNTVEKDIIQAGQSALSMARIIANSSEDFLADTLAIIEQVSQRDDIRAMDGRCSPLILDFVRLNHDYIDLTVLDMTGQPVCSGLPVPEGGTFPSMAGTEWFQRVLHEQRPVISKPDKGALFQKWAAIIAAPLRDSGGAIVGIVALPIDLGHFQSVRGSGLNDGAWITIIDAEATVVARSLEPEV
ncbi:MAG: cache domain-containing protein, partial [Rhodospirillales bacterium]|nr:cache domain-containing protein [Rhodospirillales bacterium]